MSSFKCCIQILMTLFIAFQSTNAKLPRHHHKKQLSSFPRIYVDPSGRGNYTTIQAAIDSVPSGNENWICIHIKAGAFREKVQIPYDKPFVCLVGEGRRRTYVVWQDHESIATSATFTSQADNVFVSSMSFVNAYNYPLYQSSGNPLRTAVAANIQGDKSVFNNCGFWGLQDTLWDVQGRHYFKSCIIQGATDFIFGSGQSLYERCTIAVVARALKGSPGYITAQGRTTPEETNGFVFKDCNIIGNGKAFLGRAWRGYSRVIFYSTSMSDIVVPQGWDAWGYVGHESQLSYAEADCRGLGSNTSRRVKWANNLSEDTLAKFTRISFIDDDGWLKDWMLN